MIKEAYAAEEVGRRYVNKVKLWEAKCSVVMQNRKLVKRGFAALGTRYVTSESAACAAQGFSRE